MEYKVLYRKYRPTNFSSVVGQDYTIKMLQNAIANNKISHAYLFTGPRGTGKTSTAKIFAKTINCEHLVNNEACGKCNSCLNFLNSADVIEIDAASNNGVDDVRELIENVKIAPSESKYKIYIIDEVHMMTTSAFNALLLTLEEPPAHAIFIMATTNVESVPITILSRCQRFNFKKITNEDIIKQLKYIANEENIDISDDAIEEIAYLSEGGLRDALSLLDQLSSNNEKITIDNILSNYGTISMVFIRKILENMENGCAKEILLQMEELEQTASDYKIFIKKLMKELLKKAILIKENPESSKYSYEQIKNLVFDLNDCLTKTNIHVNPYDLIKITLLNYVKNENEKTKVTKLPNKVTINEAKENIQPLKVDIPKKEEEKIDKTNEEKMKAYIEELKAIRINNCFAGATKNYLIEIQNLLKQLATNVDNPKSITYLIDSKPVASSLDVVIMASSLNSTSSLINRHLDEIEQAFNDLFNIKKKFIALSTEEWQNLKQEYIQNIKKGVKYEVIDESKLEKIKTEESDSQLEKVVKNIFDESKIEVV